jgi:hypothetical protein
MRILIWCSFEYFLAQTRGVGAWALLRYQKVTHINFTASEIRNGEGKAGAAARTTSHARRFLSICPERAKNEKTREL